MKPIGELTNASLTTQGLVIEANIYDKRVRRILNGKCSICGEKEPLFCGILNGKKGCKHYQERMRELTKYCPTCRHKVKP